MGVTGVITMSKVFQETYMVLSLFLNKCYSDVKYILQGLQECFRGCYMNALEGVT